MDNHFQWHTDTDVSPGYPLVHPKLKRTHCLLPPGGD